MTKPPSSDTIKIILYDLFPSIAVPEGVPPMYEMNDVQRKPKNSPTFSFENCIMMTDLSNVITNVVASITIHNSNLNVNSYLDFAVLMLTKSMHTYSPQWLKK